MIEELKMCSVALLLGILATVAKASTAGDEVTGMTTVGMTTIPTTIDPTFLKLAHRQSTTGSITVNWTIPEGATVDGFIVESWKTGSDAKTSSPDLEWNVTAYEVKDLLRNTPYEVCVYAQLPTGVTVDDGTDVGCLSLATIPLIRWDSLLALFCVIGVLVFLILLGWFVWRRHRNRLMGDSDSEENDGNKKSESSQPILGGNDDGRPHSSIEDQDIPYITPPIEDLQNDEKEYALRATHRKKSGE